MNSIEDRGSPDPSHRSSLLDVVERHGEWGVIATRPIPAGSFVCFLSVIGSFPHPTRFSLQADTQLHLDIGPPLRFMSHSCAPSCRVDIPERALYSLVEVRAGDELSCFYPSTEWEMAESFRCRCGAANCLGLITGAKDLPDEAFVGRPPAPHILRLRAERTSGG